MDPCQESSSPGRRTTDGSTSQECSGRGEGDQGRPGQLETGVGGGREVLGAEGGRSEFGETEYHKGRGRGNSNRRGGRGGEREGGRGGCNGTGNGRRRGMGRGGGRVGGWRGGRGKGTETENAEQNRGNHKSFKRSPSVSNTHQTDYSLEGASCRSRGRCGNTGSDRARTLPRKWVYRGSGGRRRGGGCVTTSSSSSSPTDTTNRRGASDGHVTVVPNPVRNSPYQEVIKSKYRYT